MAMRERRFQSRPGIDVSAMSRGLDMCPDTTQRRGARSVKVSCVETRNVGIVDLIVRSVSYSSLRKVKYVRTGRTLQRRGAISVKVGSVKTREFGIMDFLVRFLS